MAKKNIFISYDYDNDRAYKSLLLAWDAHKQFEFNFTDDKLTRFIRDRRLNVD